MSLHQTAQNAVMNAGTTAYNNSVTQQGIGTAIGTGITMPGGAATWSSHPMWDENHHQFNCNKVENGWTVQYRGKTFIASSLDDMMDQMKAAMVTDRIEK